MTQKPEKCDPETRRVRPKNRKVRLKNREIFNCCLHKEYAVVMLLNILKKFPTFAYKRVAYKKIRVIDN